MLCYPFPNLKNLNIKSNDFVDIIINNFNIHNNVWDSDDYIILRDYYNNVIKQLF